MNVVDIYGTQIKKVALNHPRKARNMIKAGLWAENMRCAHFPSKKLPNAYQLLNRQAVESTRKAVLQPENCALTNIFAPVEILQCFGLKCTSLECLSSFITGFGCEDFFIDYAQNQGIAPTLCSYHKNYIGCVESKVLPMPAYAITTSTVCDGNINTFRYITRNNETPLFVIDVPHEYSKEACEYVVLQLKNLIKDLEVKFQRSFSMEELRKTLMRENESKRLFQMFMKEQKNRYYPNTLTINMYLLFATHLNIGSKETLNFFQLLSKEVLDYPSYEGKKILWIHLLPYFEETLKTYFNCNGENHIQVYDFNLDYMEEMDVNHPLEALARKMICNIYNGSYERKAEFIENLVKEYQPDGIINLCHWGCKQSSGGVMLLKERLSELGKPLLILDADACDRRNCQNGQIKTRVDAFLEVLGRNE